MSIYLIAPACAWLFAQALKLLLRQTHSHRGVIDFHHLYRSGGMPSAHTAIVVSLATTVALKHGWDSVEFGIAGVMALIVIYDAINVRYIVGEHGKIIAKLITKYDDLAKSMSAPKILRGHTLSEVFGGTILGIVVAFVVVWLENS